MARHRLPLFLFLLVSACAHAVPPNIILITLDTTRADRMGFLGSKLGLTPNLDSLAGQSVVFTRAYAQVPLTTPSHAALLTGTYPQFNHVADLGTPLGKDLPYLPDLLRHHGYQTAAFVGALILDPAGKAAPGFERGFSTYDAGFHQRQGTEDRYHSLERRAEDVVDHALSWLSKHPRGPFFVWLHFYDPHDPYDPPEPFKGRYQASPYDGEIAYTDSAIGKFVTVLRQRGLYRGALIAVAADHGEAFGEHGEMRHGIFLYDETVHVPLIFKLPLERSAGARVEDRVALADVAPTILQTAGFLVPKAMQGESLVDNMKSSSASGEQANRERPIYSESDYAHRSFGWSMLRSWRAAKYLYVQAPKRELYDQSADSAAQHNLADGAKAVADTLNAQMDAFQDKTSTAQSEQIKFDPAQAETLRALGYLASDASTKDVTNKGPEIDPKDKIEIANAMQQAVVDMEEEHYDAAVPRLQRIIQDDPDTSTAYLELGRAFIHLQQYQQALPPLRQAVEKLPQSSLAHYELGFALVKVNDWNAALPQFQAVLAGTPDSPEMHFYLAAVYEQTKSLPEATKEFQETLRLKPDHFKANLMLGRIYGMQHKPTAALPLLQEAVRLNPDSGDAHAFLANVYRDLGQMGDWWREHLEVERIKALKKPRD